MLPAGQLTCLQACTWTITCFSDGCAAQLVLVCICMGKGRVRDSLWQEHGAIPRCCAGKGREVLALPAPQPTQRISALPYSTPLHRLLADTQLPSQLLTPFQACFHLHAHETCSQHTWIAATCTGRMQWLIGLLLEGL